MARKKMPWFRFYTETVTDRKIRRLKIEHRWLWVVVLCAARQSPVEGVLVLSEREPIEPADLADMGALTERQVVSGLKALEAAGLIEMDSNIGAWSVPKWGDRQYKSDNSTARVTAMRERQRRSDETLQARSSDGPSNAPETETETDVTTPLPPFAIVPPVDNRSASHGHYPYDDRPAVAPAVAQLHASLASFPGVQA